MSRVKKVIKKVIKAIYRIVVNILMFLFSLIGRITRIFDKKIAIVHVDGGLSSQLFRYTMGCVLEEKGFDVLYETAWYEKKTSKKAGYRNLLTECFQVPKEKFVSSRRLLYRFKLLYNTAYNGMAQKAQKDWNSLKAPFCMNLYEMDWIMKGVRMSKYVPWGNIENVLSEKAKVLADEIKASGYACGLHVRRGDMSYYVPGSYWKVFTPEYYQKAISMIPGTVDRLLVFSDGMDWVKKEVLPLVESTLSVRVDLVSEMGLEVYEELYLLSLCKCIIASQGSWGRTGLDFNCNKDVLFIRGFEDAAENERVFKEKYPNVNCAFFELEENMYLKN